MTADPWPSIAITAAAIALFGFLGVVGQHISDQLAARRTQGDRRTWINRRISAERDPGRRTAWRTIRDHQSEEEPW